MTYLLDSNTCIVHLRSQGQSEVSRHLAASPSGEVALSAVVLAELIFGALRSRDTSKNLAEVHKFSAGFPILPFDEGAADVHARVRAALASAGTPVGPYDSMIAATAILHGLKLVTHNTSEFSRIKGLDLEDWQIP